MSGDVEIKGRVNFTPTIKVYPEKRIPLVNNWKNQATVEIRYPGTTTPIFTQVVNTLSDGTASMQPIDVSMVPTGSYDVAVKGYSHLRRVYPGLPFISNTLNLDLSFGGDLVAGDTNNDNYINSLDLSYQVRNLYTNSDVRGDLNRDGVVNSLDISNAALNLYLKGQE